MIYINSLELNFNTKEDLLFYVKRHFDMFTKEDLKNIIVQLIEKEEYIYVKQCSISR